jgi:hypothetical protein
LTRLEHLDEQPMLMRWSTLASLTFPLLLRFSLFVRVPPRIAALLVAIFLTSF